MNKLVILLLAFSLALSVNDASAQNRKPAKAPLSNKNAAVKPAGGSASTEEIGRVLWDALLANDPERLSLYFPTAQDLQKLERTPDEDLGLVAEQSYPDQVRQAFSQDFSSVLSNLIEHSINLSDFQVSEVRTAAPKKGNRLIPVHLVVTDGVRPPLTFVFESVKINGRYFLFENLGLQTQ